MHFVEDPAIAREVGADLLSTLEDAVLPEGECAKCGNSLGSGALRWSFEELPDSAVIAATHAACGPLELRRGIFTSFPDQSWHAEVIGLESVEERTRRRWWGRKGTTTSQTYVPCLVISPTCDVFYLSRSAAGGWRSPVQDLLLEGFTSFDPMTFASGTTPSTVTAQWANPRFSVTIDGTKTYWVEEPPDGTAGTYGVANMIRRVGGVLLIVTHAASERLLLHHTQTHEERTQMLTSPHTAVAWVLASDIAGLNS
ncbi:hypothetical protein [Microbacterium oleivorans]|uniref:hypothetical protein n=1 Tax=Microbacterium oleivorans TaxID=273677 RepID=UPI0011463898|nr:hypothetical protein [Microbacterium oleivorans]